MDIEAQTSNFVNQPLFTNKDTLKNNNNRKMKVQFAFWHFGIKQKPSTVPADLHTTYSHVKMEVFTGLHSVL